MGSSRAGRSGGRIALTLLALAVLEGCAFGIPLKKSTVVPQQAERSATIRLGEAMRAEVRAALGDPWLESDLWRAEVYRSDDKRTELGFAVAIVIPVPVGVFSEKRHGYVLVTYDAAGRVSEVSPGVASDGMLASNTGKWLAIRAGEISFVVDPVGNKTRSTLLADASRLAGYLEERRRADGCTLVAACAGDEGCPDELAVDGGEPFDPSPVTALCAPGAPCPKGAQPTETLIEGKRFVLVPVLHAIDVAPGRHHLRVTSSRIRGGAETSFECAQGEALFGAIRSHAVGASWFSKGTLEATVTFSATPPAAWESYSIELVRNGRWLVEKGTASPPGAENTKGRGAASGVPGPS